MGQPGIALPRNARMLRYLKGPQRSSTPVSRVVNTIRNKALETLSLKRACWHSRCIEQGELPPSTTPPPPPPHRGNLPPARYSPMKSSVKKGFTLIELLIV